VPVVINEFEVVPEAAPATAPATQTEPPTPLAPSAPEIERVVSHLVERATRVSAS
jgi:hypothetical protein